MKRYLLAANDCGGGAPCVEPLKARTRGGFVAAEYNLSYMYERGLGGPADAELAAKWKWLASRQRSDTQQWRRAALASPEPVLDSPTAVATLEEGIVAYGAGDYATALSIWVPLAEKGNADAQYNLGVLYDLGRGVPQDLTEAAIWYGKAAEKGNMLAKSRLASIERELEVHPLSRRVALVFGNSHYANVARLPNAENDATDVSAALERIGFRVTQVQDADYGKMRASLQKFSAEADGAEMAVVYYAGHGFEVDNSNYLVPVDARLKTDRDIDFETIPLALVEGSVSGAKTLSMVILDACRDNPFAIQMALASPTRSIGRGLSRVEPLRGVLVAYSAKAGSVAADGEGRNSPFASAFIEYLDDPGLDVGFMFRKIGDAVMLSTNNQQEPFVYGRLPGDAIYLVAPQ